MASVVAVLDACVLYPAPIRDLLMQLAKQDAFQARWSDDIHDEWIRSVLADRDDLTPAQLARTRALMDTHVPDALVTGYLDMLPSLALPDPDDRHVLAAAIVSRSTVIITFNLKDFPDDKLALYDCRAVHPDDFLLDLAGHTPDQMIQATHAILRRLRNPPVTLNDYFDMLRKIGLPATAHALTTMKSAMTL
jgi:predicted nucleic acid-binding protein